MASLRTRTKYSRQRLTLLLTSLIPTKEWASGEVIKVSGHFVPDGQIMATEIVDFESSIVYSKTNRKIDDSKKLHFDRPERRAQKSSKVARSGTGFDGPWWTEASESDDMFSEDVGPWLTKESESDDMFTSYDDTYIEDLLIPQEKRTKKSGKTLDWYEGTPSQTDSLIG